MSQQQRLSVEQQKLSDLWDEHVRTEFSAHAADEAIATMVENPFVNEVPLLIGGNSGREVYEFYSKYFLSQIPPDLEMIPISRTIGQDRVVEEMVIRFTHTIPMDWLAAGHPAHRKARRIRFCRGGSVRGRQVGARTLVLGPSVSAGAARVAQSQGSAGGGSGGHAFGARSEHTVECPYSPRRSEEVESPIHSRESEGSLCR